MPQRLALTISLIFHPLLLPTLIMGLMFFISPNLVVVASKKGRWLLLEITFLLTFSLPVLIMIILRRLQVISSLSLPSRQERRLPFAIICVIYAATTYLFYILTQKIYLDEKILLVFGSICFSLFLLTIITFFYKISAHNLAIAGVFGGMLAMALRYHEYTLGFPLAITAIVWGAVASARLSMKAHSWQEVFWGSVVGFWINFLIVLLWKV